MGNRSYTIGNSFGVFPYEVLSVSAPITGNYNTYGYVLVHLPISAIQQIKDNIFKYPVYFFWNYFRTVPDHFVDIHELPYIFR